MATSGVFNGSMENSYSWAYQYMRFSVEWSRNSYDLKAGTSNITVTCTVWSTAPNIIHPYDRITKPTVTLLIGGKAVTPSVDYIDTRNGKKNPFAVWTGNVSHEADGNLTLSIEVSFRMLSDDVSLKSGYASGKAVLPRLERATVPVLSVSEGTIGDTVEITLSPMLSEYTHILTYECEGTVGEIADPASLLTRWEIPQKILSDSSSAEPTVTVICTTYLDGETIGTVEAALTVIIPENEDTRPKATVTFSSYNPLSDIFDGLYIKGKTGIRADFEVSDYGEGVETGSASLSVAYSDRTAEKCDGLVGSECDGLVASICVDPLTVAGEATVTASLRNSRGFAVTEEKTIRIYDYVKPSVTAYGENTAILCRRADNMGTVTSGGTFLRVSAGKRCTPLGGKNTCKLSVSVKERDALESYGEPLLLLDYDAETVSWDGVVSGVVLDRDTAYSVLLTVSDLVGESVFYEAVIPAASCPLHEGKGGRNLGIGGFCNYDNKEAVDLWWDIFEHSGIGTVPYHLIGEETDEAAMDAEIGAYATGLRRRGYYRFVYLPAVSHRLFGSEAVFVEGFRTDGCGWQRLTQAISQENIPKIYIRSEKDGVFYEWIQI